MKELDKVALINIFKLKTLLFSKFMGGDAVPMFLSGPKLSSTTQNFNQNFKTLPSFFALGEQASLRYYHLLLSEHKLLEFRQHFSLSRFSTLKKKFLDRRFSPPRGVEFDFLLDPTPMLLSSIVRAKVPLRLFVSKFFFMNLFYKKHLKRFSFSTYIEPYDKFLSVKLHKRDAHLSAFFFNLFDKSLINGLKGLMLLKNISVMCLANFFSGKLLSNLLFTVPFKGNMYFYFLLIFRSWALVNKPNYSGLIMFRDYRRNVTNATMEELISRVGQTGVKHFGWHYPFDPKDEFLFSRSKKFTSRFLGKSRGFADSTNFFLLTKKMLRRRFNLKQVYKPYYENNTLPKKFPEGATTILSNIIQRYFPC